MTEAFLLALAGAVVGSVVAEFLLRIFIAIAPAGLLFLSKARLDFRIVMFTILLSLVCAILFGVASALQRPRRMALAARSKTVYARAAVRRCLVVAQIAISIVLLSGAMLLLRSFWNLQGQHLGMQTRHVLTVSVSVSDDYRTGQKQMEFYQRAEQAMRRLPGVMAVGLSDSLPPGGWQNGGWSGEMAISGEPKPASGAGSPIAWRWVTPDYFHALNVPIVQGQNFTDEERNSGGHFMILSKLLADRMFPEGNAIGQSIKPGPNEPRYLVVGVAANVKNSGLASQSKPEYYRLRRDFVADWDPKSWGIHCVMLVESALPARVIAPWMRSQIAQIDPTAAVEVTALNQQVSKLAARPRFATTLLGFFAVTGLLMAILGLYGVIAFVTTQRTQEIGVRMALGADRFNILGLIVWEGLRLIVVGSVVGLGIALGLCHLLRSLLFQISPYDPLSFIGMAMMLAVVAVLATLVPARSAMQVDPVVALRHE